MTMGFYVGQRVKCVKRNGWETARPGEICPIYGQELTVRAVAPEDGFLRFAEIRNEFRHYFEGWAECEWNPVYFRPITESKTDISIFKKMLEPNRKNKINETID